jgi:hypothetical protein
LNPIAGLMRPTGALNLQWVAVQTRLRRVCTATHLPFVEFALLKRPNPNIFTFAAARHNLSIRIHHKKVNRRTVSNKSA